MRKHLRTAAFIVLLAFVGLPLTGFAWCYDCNNNHKDPCNPYSSSGSPYSSSGSTDSNSGAGNEPVDVVGGDSFLEDAWEVVKSWTGPLSNTLEFVMKHMPVPQSMDPNEKIPGSTMPFLEPPHAVY